MIKFVSIIKNFKFLFHECYKGCDKIESGWKGFLLGKRNSFYLINLLYTIIFIRRSLIIIFLLIFYRRKILIYHKDIRYFNLLQVFGKVTDQVGFSGRWSGGLLTNYKQIKYLYTLQLGQLHNWPSVQLIRKLIPITNYLKAGVPSCLILFLNNKNLITLLEAIKMRIPTIILTDTNNPPFCGLYPIFTNSINYNLVNLFIRLFFLFIKYIKYYEVIWFKGKVQDNFQYLEKFRLSIDQKHKGFSFLNYLLNFSHFTKVATYERSYQYKKHLLETTAMNKFRKSFRVKRIKNNKKQVILKLGKKIKRSWFMNLINKTKYNFIKLKLKQ